MDFKNEKIPFKIPALIIFVFATPILCIFIYASWDFIFNRKSNSEYFLESRLEENCSGTIDSIYRQKNNHNNLTLRTNNCNFEVDYPWENKLQLGDSISKKAKESTIKIFRENRLLEMLDYKDIAKTIK